MMTLGIDPGLDGAVALYDGVNVRIWDMPTLQLGKRGKAKRKVDRHELFRLVARLAQADVALAAVEDVGGKRRQSASASCNFGKNAGYAEMAVIASGLRILDVSPVTYKTHHFRIPSSPDRKERKRLARAKATELMPAAARYFSLKGDDGRAESALLALYAYRQLSASAP
jgi:hypothetical protein